jgi:hypothetical protein
MEQKRWKSQREQDKIAVKQEERAFEQDMKAVQLASEKERLKYEQDLKAAHFASVKERLKLRQQDLDLQEDTIDLYVARQNELLHEYKNTIENTDATRKDDYQVEVGPANFKKDSFTKMFQPPLGIVNESKFAEYQLPLSLDLMKHPKVELLRSHAYYEGWFDSLSAENL